MANEKAKRQEGKEKLGSSLLTLIGSSDENKY